METRFLTHVLICGGAGCVSSGCKKVKEAFLAQLEEKALSDDVKVVETGCIGSCDLGPVMVIYPEVFFIKSPT